MADRQDPRDERQAATQPPEAEYLDAEQVAKLKRCKERELMTAFAVVMGFLLVLLLGFCVYIYKRMAG